ncbi:sodium-coupled monocarboxylate transporter 1-like [Dermacentor variabilis]|uniref:sodium-coupled monocarboxylate transporter 1-like n=1 Tax=Dermacentor variabilis TaxID=34621 RepID=UPI003F5B8C9D
MNSTKSLDAADCAVFGILTVVGYLVGLYFSVSRRKLQVAHIEDSGDTSVEVDAFLGGRSLPASALAVSLLASVVTGVSVVSFVGHFYAYGFHLTWTTAAIPVAMVVTSTTLVPLLYDVRAASVFQYLRLRFDNTVGITACIVYFFLSQILGAVGIYSAAIGISTMFRVPLLYTSVAIGLAGTIYTALGGLRGVVWADCVQAAVMFASPLIIIGKVIYDSGDASPPLRSLSDLNTTEYILRTNLDLTTDENVWSSLVGGLPYALVRTGFDQMAFQRFMAARTLKDAKRIVVASAVLVIIFFIIVEVAALSLIYWYRDCDPLLSGAISSPDQIVPYFLRESLSGVTMLRGLFLAGLLGASTSTVSSIVNSHAAVFYIDIFTPFVTMNERRAAFVMRLLAFASGTLMTLFAIAVPYIGAAAQLFMSLFSSASGPFAGLVLLAISSPWVNAKGAAWASLGVCVLQLWHALGRRLTGVGRLSFIPGTLDRCPLDANDTSTDDSATVSVYQAVPTTSAYVLPLYRLSFFWIAFIGLLLTLLLGTIFSLATGGARKAQRNLKLTSPAFLIFWYRFKFLRPAFQHNDGKEEDVLETPKVQCDVGNTIPGMELPHWQEQHGLLRDSENVTHECAA